MRSRQGSVDSLGHVDVDEEEQRREKKVAKEKPRRPATSSEADAESRKEAERANPGLQASALQPPRADVADNLSRTAGRSTSKDGSVREAREEPTMRAAAVSETRVHTDAAAASSRSSTQVKRFLLRFEPPMLAIEWTGGSSDQIGPKPGVSGRQLMPIPIDARDLTDTQALARKLVHESTFLSRQHHDQVESLLQQLAARVLPVYRVVHSSGADVVPDAEPQRAPLRPATAELPNLRLPSGALVLVHERAWLPQEGWWLRLAAGGGWVRAAMPSTPGGVASEQLVAERWQPEIEEARNWLRRCEDDDSQGKACGCLLAQHAWAVLAQTQAHVGRTK